MRCSGLGVFTSFSQSLYLSLWGHTDLKPKPDLTMDSLTFQDDGPRKSKVSISQGQEGREALSSPWLGLVNTEPFRLQFRYPDKMPEFDGAEEQYVGYTT